MPMAASDIERLIRARIPDAEVTIRDLAGDGDHYAATVIAESFRGKSRSVGWKATASRALSKSPSKSTVRSRSFGPGEEDIQHDMYRPYWFDRISAGLDANGMPITWDHRFAGSSVLARWAPPFFRNGLDPDTPEGAINLVYALPNLHVEYVRVEPPGIPTAFWRSVGPSHNVFVTESFIDELAVAAKQDPVAYRRALLGKSPRAKAVLDLAAEKAGWGQSQPQGFGRGVSLQFVFATYMAQIAEVEVSKDGKVRVHRIVCAVDCGTPVNPDTIRAQIQSAIIFGITAALYGEITLKDGRVQQTNFDTYQILRMDEAPAIEVHIVQNSELPGG